MITEIASEVPQCGEKPLWDPTPDRWSYIAVAVLLAVTAVLPARLWYWYALGAKYDALLGPSHGMQFLMWTFCLWCMTRVMCATGVFHTASRLFTYWVRMSARDRALLRKEKKLRCAQERGQRAARCLLALEEFRADELEALDLRLRALGVHPEQL